MKMLAVLFLGISSLSAQAGQIRDVNNIPKFAKVSEGIYRGGRPGKSGVKYLARFLEVKTIINLENADSYVRQEEAQAKSLGIDFYSVPLSVYETPRDSDIDQVLELLADPSRYPVFVHCKHGEDRTGLLVGLFRVLKEGWTQKVAYQEMLDLDFHPFFSKLTEYFKDRTGSKY